MARPRAQSGADAPKEPHSVSLKGESKNYTVQSEEYAWDG